jgi:mono/diheme cytochrome c family protein
MNNTIRILLPVCAALLLAACEQPEPEAEQPVAPEATSETAVGGDTLVSIDADGNIAPFGYASKQPVPVPDAPAAAGTVAAAAASSATYSVHCVACHGADAAGVEGLGLNLVESQLVASASPAELTAFLKEGRLPDSPDSVTGIPMPAFAWMTDEQLAEVTAYLKSL